MDNVAGREQGGHELIANTLQYIWNNSNRKVFQDEVWNEQELTSVHYHQLMTLTYLILLKGSWF